MSEKRSTAGKLKTVSEFMQTLKYCLSLSWKATKFYTVASFSVRLLAPVMGLISIYLGKAILDAMVAGQNNPSSKNYLIHLFIIFGVISITNVILEKFGSYVDSMHDECVNGTITANIMDAAINADIQLFDNPKAYDKLALAVNNSSVAPNILRSSIRLVSTAVSFLTAFFILLCSNWSYCLALTMAAFPSAIVLTRYTKLIYLLDIDQIGGQREKQYYFYIATSKVFSQDIRLHNLVSIIKSKYSTLWNTLFTVRRKKVKSRTIFTVIFGCLPELISVFILINVGMNILIGRYSIGDYSLYSGLITQLIYSVAIVIMTLSTLYDNRLRIDNIREIEKFPRTSIELGVLPLKKVNKIEFKNVWFRYPNTQTDVLKSVDFEVLSGERIALVGINGSGKSTIIKLLLRFYAPTKGTILINGEDIQKYDIISLHKTFCCYFQNAENYAFSLREDLKLANIDKKADESEMLQALKDAGADVVLRKFPNSIDTYISRMFKEDGAEISIGEHQMISLSRTFYRNSQIVILDEPSSSLDPEAENRLFSKLERFCEGKTVLFTSHRLSNIGLSTRILVIENGIIIEDGSQEELLQNSSRYRQLFNYQAEKYKM